MPMSPQGGETSTPVRATVRRDATADVVIDGVRRSLAAADVDEARRAVRAIVVEHARVSGYPVRLHATDPLGRWDLLVQPDGAVTEAPDALAEDAQRPDPGDRGSDSTASPRPEPGVGGTGSGGTGSGGTGSGGPASNQPAGPAEPAVPLATDDRDARSGRPPEARSGEPPKARPDESSDDWSDDWGDDWSDEEPADRTRPADASDRPGWDASEALGAGDRATTRMRRRLAAVVSAVAVAAVAIVVTLTLDDGRPAAQTPTADASAPSPTATGPVPLDVPDGALPDLVLDAPQDGGGEIELAWSGGSGLQYVLLYSADGGTPAVTYLGESTSVAVVVEEGTGYCFQVIGSDGASAVVSQAEAVRGGACPFGASLESQDGAAGAAGADG